ncbi:unnamed protein product [Discula destructiva]
MPGDCQHQLQTALKDCASTLVEIQRASACYASICKLSLDPLKKLYIKDTIIQVECFWGNMKSLANSLSALCQPEVESNNHWKSINDAILCSIHALHGLVAVMHELGEIFIPTSEFRRKLTAKDSRTPPAQATPKAVQSHAATQVFFEDLPAHPTQDSITEKALHNNTSLTESVEYVAHEIRQDDLLREALRATAAGRPAFISLDKEADDALRQAAIERIASTSVPGKNGFDRQGSCACSQQDNERVRAATASSDADNRLPRFSSEMTTDFDTTNAGTIPFNTDSDLLNSAASQDDPFSEESNVWLDLECGSIWDAHLLSNTEQNKQAKASAKNKTRTIQDQVSRLLKQLSADNFDHVAQEIVRSMLQLENHKDDRILQQVVQTIFETACKDSTRAGIYATLLTRFGAASTLEAAFNKKSHNLKAGVKQIKAHLRSVCAEFCKRKWLDHSSHLPLETHLGVPYVLCALFTQNTSESSSQRMLNEMTMYECAISWLNPVILPPMLGIARLYSILRVVGNALDLTQTGHDQMDRLMKRISRVIEDPMTPIRGKTLLRELVVHREHDWANMSAGTGLPKAVIKAIAQELQLARGK